MPNQSNTLISMLNDILLLWVESCANSNFPPKHGESVPERAKAALSLWVRNPGSICNDANASCKSDTYSLLYNLQQQQSRSYEVATNGILQLGSPQHEELSESCRVGKAENHCSGRVRGSSVSLLMTLKSSFPLASAGRFLLYTFYLFKVAKWTFANLEKCNHPLRHKT